MILREKSWSQLWRESAGNPYSRGLFLIVVVCDLALLTVWMVTLYGLLSRSLGLSR